MYLVIVVPRFQCKSVFGAIANSLKDKDTEKIMKMDFGKSHNKTATFSALFAKTRSVMRNRSREQFKLNIAN